MQILPSLARYTAIAVLLVLASVSHAADTIANWKEDSGFAEATAVLPKGAQVRIRVVAKGDSGHVRITGGGKILQDNRWTTIAANQVLKYSLSQPIKISVSVSSESPGLGAALGAYHIQKNTGIKAEDGFHRMTFEGGWVLEVKVVPEEF